MVDLPLGGRSFSSDMNNVSALFPFARLIRATPSAFYYSDYSPLLHRYSSSIFEIASPPSNTKSNILCFRSKISPNAFSCVNITACNFTISSTASSATIIDLLDGHASKNSAGDQIDRVRQEACKRRRVARCRRRMLYFAAEVKREAPRLRASAEPSRIVEAILIRSAIVVDDRLAKMIAIAQRRAADPPQIGVYAL